MEKGALLLPDVDEGGLDAGEHRLDPAEVDVADHAAVVGTVDQQLDEPVVLEDGHAGLPLAPVDQDLALQAMTSATAGDADPRAPRRPHTPRACPESGLSVCSDRADRGRQP